MHARLTFIIALLVVAMPAAAQTWTPPRTPWGDPDLQGNYSNKYEQGTPFERPAEFDGRTIDDIKGEELANLLVSIKRSIDGPEGKVNFEIRDVYSVSGNVLTLERSQGSRTQKTLYNRGG
jgi:hypothetical protein